MHESNAQRIVTRVENRLAASGFLARVKLGTGSDFDVDNRSDDCDVTTRSVVILDASEVPIERPKKSKRHYYSGKTHTHTLKFQIVINTFDSRILQVAVSQSNEHDITLARQQRPILPQGTPCLADSGYQGLVLEYCTVLYPFKKPKRRPLEPEEKACNQRLAQFRVKVEQCIRTLKVFRILKGVYRGRRQRFDLRLSLIAELVNRMSSSG